MLAWGEGHSLCGKWRLRPGPKVGRQAVLSRVTTELSSSAGCFTQAPLEWPQTLFWEKDAELTLIVNG